MVALQVYSVDDPAVSGGGGFGVKVPDDTYKAIIVKSEMVPGIVAGNPEDLMLKVVISDGKHNGKEFDVRLGISNSTPIKADKPEWTWQRAAYSNIAQISKALGMTTTPSNTEALHGKPLLIETATTLGKDKETGSHKPEWDKSYIKAYRALPSTGTPTPANQSAVAPAAIDSGTAKPPWEN